MHGMVSESSECTVPVLPGQPELGSHSLGHYDDLRRSARSSGVIPRPRRILVPTVEKYSGETDWRVNSPSRSTESMPATNRFSAQVSQNGTVSPRAALCPDGPRVRLD
jgi:hypothetical protein